MPPKRNPSEKDAPPAKKQCRKTITLEQKVGIIRRYDRGESTVTIKAALNLLESTLQTIRKDKEKILAAFKAGAGSSATRVSSGQSMFMVRMEKMLITWMDHCKHQGLNVTFDNTKRKAMDCYHHQKVKETGPIPEFVASTVWFYKFKGRLAFHNVMRSGETRSADADAAASFPYELRAIIKERGYKPQQVFNIDEKGLQLEKMPDHTYITREEKYAPGFKAFKDRFTLLLRANLTGEWRL